MCEGVRVAVSVDEPPAVQNCRADGSGVVDGEQPPTAVCCLAWHFSLLGAGRCHQFGRPAGSSLG